MADPTLPGVTVDEGSVSDFLSGLRDSNFASNTAARNKAAGISVGLIAYTAYRNIRSKRAAQGKRGLR